MRPQVWLRASHLHAKLIPPHDFFKMGAWMLFSFLLNILLRPLFGMSFVRSINTVLSAVNPGVDTQKLIELHNLSTRSTVYMTLR